jgi:NADH:ubiquinone reductase (non-electrogenic)
VRCRLYSAGVHQHAHFLKELPDARRIRAAVSDCFESAVLPSQTPEERARLLRFVVVGGGPTGIEFAGMSGDDGGDRTGESAC